MASNLPGDICVGQHSVCIVRAAKLAPGCAPLGGTDSGFITTGIITATASPELQEGRTLEPLLGCGDTAWTYEERDRIRRYTLSGELAFFDHELMEVLFGGTLIVGGAQSDFVGDVIGWAAPNYTDEPAPDVYLEFIVKTAARGVGECSSGGAAFPAAVGHIFGKAALVPGDSTFSAEAATVNFNGTSTANPALSNGPWGDWPGVETIPASGHVQVSYSFDEYDAIAELAACGYATLPEFGT